MKGQAGHRRCYYSLRMVGEEAVSHSLVSTLRPRIAKSCIKHQKTFYSYSYSPTPHSSTPSRLPNPPQLPPPSRLPSPPQPHPHLESPALHSISLSWRCSDKKTKANRYKLGRHRQVFIHEYLHCFCFYSLAHPHTQLLGMHVPFFPCIQPIHPCMHLPIYLFIIHPSIHISTNLSMPVSLLLSTQSFTYPSHSILQDN